MVFFPSSKDSFLTDRGDRYGSRSRSPGIPPEPNPPRFLVPAHPPQRMWPGRHSVPAHPGSDPLRRGVGPSSKVRASMGRLGSIAGLSGWDAACCSGACSSSVAAGIGFPSTGSTKRKLTTSAAGSAVGSGDTAGADSAFLQPESSRQAVTAVRNRSFSWKEVVAFCRLIEKV